MNENPSPDFAADPALQAGSSSSPSTSRPTTGGWQPPAPEVLQQQIPQYKVLDLLGRGGMGAVYKGWQVSLERYVAIKILPPDIDDGDAQFAARFKQEAKTMAKLQHPGIVAVIDTGETAAGLLYFVMEFIEGTDVADMLKRKGHIDPISALAITAHVCDALHYAHTHGVVHRDIKPANIMVNSEGLVKVADFGLAKGAGGAGHGLTRSDMSMGTPDFIAPEALTIGVITDHRADLYAVGVMLYNMLTGELPRGMFRMPSQKVGTDPRFDDIVRRALEPERDHRYQNAQEIRRDLDAILATPLEREPTPTQAAQPTVPPPTRPQQQSPRRPQAGSPRPPSARQEVPQSVIPVKKAPTALIAGVLGGIAVLGLAGWFLFGKKAPPPATAGGSAKTQQSPTPRAAPPTALPATGWQSLFPPEEWRANVPDKHEYVDGFLHLRSNLRKPAPSPDMAIRARIVLRKGSITPTIFVRNSSEGAYGFALASDRKNVVLTYAKSGNRDREELARAAFPASLQADDEFSLELRAQGTHLTALFNGQLMCEVDDDRAKLAGDCGITAMEGWFRGVDVQTLISERWHEVLHDGSRLDIAGGASRSPAGATFTGGGSILLPGSLKPRHDGAVRMRALYNNSMHPGPRLRMSPAGFYTAYFRSESNLLIAYWDTAAGRTAILRDFHFSTPMQPGQSYELELRIVGRTLTVKLDGKNLGSATDADLTEGQFGMGLSEKTGSPTTIQSIEILDLDGGAP